MTRVIFNALVILGIVVGSIGTICHFRVMYHVKDSRHWWYGGMLSFRPDLLTPQGRRLCAIGWLSMVAFLFIWFIAFCLAHTLPPFDQ
jgi:Trk-type K+ transport system membrane component